MITKYFIVCFLLLAGYSTIAQEVPGTFYVTIGGDTVRNLHSPAIISDHPQALWIKVNGKGKRIPADSIAFLRIYERDIVNFRNKIMADYTVMRMPSKNTKRPYCAHFIRPVYVYNSTAVMYTPFCNQCSSLILYLVYGNKYIGQLRKQNFSELVGEYFSGCTQLVNYAQNNKYTASRFLKHLKKKELEPCR